MVTGTSAREAILKGLIHDLGNLAYRLTFLSANLETRIPDRQQRDESIALLQDTTERLQRVIEKLREVRGDV